MKKEIKVIEEAAQELDYIFSDSCKYPQLEMPPLQHERVKNLMFDLRTYISKHPFRTKRP